MSVGADDQRRRGSTTTRRTPSRSRVRARVARALVLAVILAAVLGDVGVARAATVQPPKLNVAAADLVTAGGLPLWSYKPAAHRRVASDMKMLTALVVRDHTKLTDVVVVPKQSAKVSSGGVGLVPGQRLTVLQLLRIMLIPSANDAAVALAVHVGGSQSHFVAMMNTKAKALGLSDTHATDPDGLNKKETSTAADLISLAKRVMADPVLAGIVDQKNVRVPRKNGSVSTVGSSDLLLGHYKGLLGVKTGFTNPAGYCFVACAKRGEVELYGAVLGAKSESARFSQMRKLLDWGFAHCHVRTLCAKDETIGVVAAPVSGEASITLGAGQELSAPVLDGSPAARFVLALEDPLPSVIATDQVLGCAGVLEGSSVVASITVEALSASTEISSTPAGSAIWGRAPSRLRFAECPASPQAMVPRE
jgi:D-alanyl-D-alanine carboxypeptidase (penicillin-binding protein 5/6)